MFEILKYLFSDRDCNNDEKNIKKIKNKKKYSNDKNIKKINNDSKYLNLCQEYNNKKNNSKIDIIDRKYNLNLMVYEINKNTVDIYEKKYYDYFKFKNYFKKILDIELINMNSQYECSVMNDFNTENKEIINGGNNIIIDEIFKNDYYNINDDIFIKNKDYYNYLEYENLDMNNEYEFKKMLKNIATETFVNNVLSTEHYILLCNYVYFELYMSLYLFIYKYNSYNKINITDDDINILYKSGNTTKLYLHILKNNFDNIGYNNDDFNFFYYSNKYGDFDYNIFINYEKLKNKNFDNKMIQELKNKFDQILLLSVNDIKNTIHNISNTFYSKKFIEEIVKKIEDKNIFNNFIKDDITNINIDVIKSYNYKYINNKIHKDFDNTLLNKLSLFVDKKDKTENKNEYSQVINKMYYYNNKNHDILFPDIIPNNFYITNIKNVSFSKNKLSSYFSLIRLKINNLYNINKKYNDVNKNIIKNYIIPIELLDLSSCYVDSMTDNYIAKCIKDLKFKKFQDVRLLNKKFNMDYKVSIPSPHYMFVDIMVILFIVQIVPWFDIKYEKRILRLLYIIIICNLDIKNSITNIIDNINKFLLLIDDVKNKELSEYFYTYKFNDDIFFDIIPKYKFDVYFNYIISNLFQCKLFINFYNPNNTIIIKNIDFYNKYKHFYDINLKDTYIDDYNKYIINIKKNINIILLLLKDMYKNNINYVDMKYINDNLI